MMFGAWKSAPWIVVVAAWGGLLIGGVYMLRSIRTVLHGALPEEWNGVPDATCAWRRLPFALLAGGLLFLGVFPSTVTRRVQPALTRVVEQARPKPAKAAVVTPDGNAAGALAATVTGR